MDIEANVSSKRLATAELPCGDPYLRREFVKYRAALALDDG
jgi:hypothetical protein